MKTYDQKEELNKNQVSAFFCGDLPNGDTLIGCPSCGHEQCSTINSNETSEFCLNCGKELMYWLACSW